MRGCREALCVILLAATTALSADSRAADAGVAQDALIESLTGAVDPLVRAAAAEKLGLLNPVSPGAAERIVPVLLETLSFDLDFPVRGRAAEALGRLGPLTPDVVPALTAALEWDTHLMVRWHTTGALERIASQHPETAAAIVPALLTSLEGDSYPGVRARAAHALGTVDPGAADVVPALLHAFRLDAHPGVRRQAAAALARLGEHYAKLGKTAVLMELRAAEAALAPHPHPDIRRSAQSIGQSIRRLEAQDTRQLSN